MTEVKGVSGWRRLRWIAAGVAGGLLAGGATVWAVGGDELGGGGLRRHFLMHRFAHGGGLEPGDARAHVEMGVRWVMGFVDATPEQRQRVQAIAQGAVDDLLPLREQHKANREAIRAALSGATVDREALEQARKAELKLADEASVRLTRAVADAAEVLSPEQRAQLAEAAARFHHH
jgi:Spy/CpxP family protein refolding chaperone